MQNVDKNMYYEVICLPQELLLMALDNPDEVNTKKSHMMDTLKCSNQKKKHCNELESSNMSQDE